jgi:hypothetical protein
MPKTPFGYVVKAQVLDNAIDILKSETRSTREIEIQVDKLRRMALNYYDTLPGPPACGAPLRRACGRGRRRLAQQSKLVDRLFTKMTSEILRSTHPSPPEHRRIPALSCKLTHLLNEAVHEAAVKLDYEAARRALSTVNDIKQVTCLLLPDGSGLAPSPRNFDLTGR